MTTETINTTNIVDDDDALVPAIPVDDGDDDIFDPEAQNRLAFLRSFLVEDEGGFDFDDYLRPYLERYVSLHSDFVFTAIKEKALRWHSLGLKVFSVGVYQYPSGCTSAASNHFCPPSSQDYPLYKTPRF